MTKQIVLILAIFLCIESLKAQSDDIIDIRLDTNIRHQTIHSFGASDCWRTQFIGANWSRNKRKQMAELLFSTKLDEAGNPVGIGLSMWRFNIGSGSHEAGGNSGVSSLWRRTECFLNEDGSWDWSKQAGQRWFLDAARQHGVKYTLGFSITPPYFMTRNGMCRASKGDNANLNIRDDQYDHYASFMAKVSKRLGFDYLSPINEPQWDWNGSSQEGTPATNSQCYKLISELDKHLQGAKTKVIFGEAGDIRYLYREGTDKPQRDNQIEELFDISSPHSILKFGSVAPVVSGHSYWSTFPVDTMINTRKELLKSITSKLPENITYWQSEYCPMEKNADNPHGGGGRDTGMATALYIARVIHYDMTISNASSWQSWTAFSEWNYKDGLIFIDDGKQTNGASSLKDPMVESCKYNGTFRTSKYLWALGNFSRFVRPGMVRIGVVDNINPLQQAYDLMTSAYMNVQTKQIAVVFINYSQSAKKIKLSATDNHKSRWSMFITSAEKDLAFCGTVEDYLSIPPSSVVTLTNSIEIK